MAAGCAAAIVVVRGLKEGEKVYTSAFPGRWLEGNFAWWNLLRPVSGALVLSSARCGGRERPSRRVLLLLTGLFGPGFYEERELPSRCLSTGREESSRYGSGKGRKGKWGERRGSHPTGARAFSNGNRVFYW